jgi:hypothetical protein
MPKRKTNVQFIKGFMEQGALHQPFVLEALSWYSKEILAKQDELRAAKNIFVSPDAWINIAKEYQASEIEFMK